MVAFYKNFNDQCISVKSLIFCVGLSLTIWRSSECLQKYLHANLSTKVTMVKTNEVILPSLVLCPATKYNHRYKKCSYYFVIIFSVTIFLVLSMKLESDITRIIEEETFLATHHWME